MVTAGCRSGEGIPVDAEAMCGFVTGFEQSLESRHVMELGEKLASFDIETDTDVSVYPTDTGQHTPTIYHLHF